MRPSRYYRTRRLPDTIMHMKQYLAESIRQALHAAGIENQFQEISLEKPKQTEHGDLSTNIAMLLAKSEKKNPREIANAIVKNLPLDERMIESVELAGPGFINFRFARQYLYDMLANILTLGESYGRADEHAGKSVNVEWVSANPTGPLHAGHGRQVCLGETLCCLLEWTGWNVTREYYFNNAGSQMNNLALSVRARYWEVLGQSFSQEDIQYVGDYIKEIAQEILSEFGNEKHDADLEFFRKRGEEWCFNRIKQTLDRLHVHHDVYFNEDSLYKEGKIDVVLKELRSRGLAYESEGAIWLKTTAFGTDKDRVIVKSTGEPTYRLPDIAYHCDKIRRGYDRIIDIFGADHIATIPDVINGVKAIGLPADHIDVVIHQMVSFVNEGEAVKMSKRSGNVYYLEDLIDDVGADAVRYFFVMRSANAHLEFDLSLAQEKSEKNPVYYLQYAHARIASILRFAEEEGASSEDAHQLELLTHDSEITLIKTVLDFPETVSFCARTYETQHLCTYLHSVATAFHKFYHDCRVVTDEVKLTTARLFLCHAARQVLANGLAILGITAPERM